MSLVLEHADNTPHVQRAIPTLASNRALGKAFWWDMWDCEVAAAAMSGRDEVARLQWCALSDARQRQGNWSFL
jgi:hypothetical protein